MKLQLSRLPGLRMLKSYNRSWLARDLTAGIVLSMLLVPQGMAYAELAGLPVITGLYTTVFCLIGYALFGPSRILVLGPDSSLGPIISIVIVSILGSSANPQQAIALASLLALTVGAIMIIFGIAKFGFIADLLSKPTRIGYMNGLALTIFIGQLPKLFGFSVSASGLIDEASAFVQGVLAGQTVRAALAMGLVSLGLILVLKRMLPRVPGVLVAVLVAIAASSVFDLASRGVSLVGVLPQGLPPLTLPGLVSLSSLPLVIAGALAIMLVAVTDTISTASSFAARTRQEVNGNGEIIGIGVANVAASLFQGFPVSTSSSRTAVAEQSGAKTQVTGLVGALVIVLMLIFLPGLFRNLPQPTLAAVVIAASLSLADIPATVRFWHLNRAEFFILIAAFLGVAFLGVITGIVVAITLSVFVVFKRSWWPYHTVLGRVPKLLGYHDRQEYPDAEELPGLVIFRFEAPLFFANARTFREQIKHIAAQKPRWIVVAAEPIADIDTTAADTIADLIEKLNVENIFLVFAELKESVREKFQRYEDIQALNPDRFFPTLDAAINAYGKKTGIRWTRSADN